MVVAVKTCVCPRKHQNSWVFACVCEGLGVDVLGASVVDVFAADEVQLRHDKEMAMVELKLAAIKTVIHTTRFKLNAIQSLFT